MLQAVSLLHDTMLRLTNIRGTRCRRWGAAVVLMAVVALTASVATRYGYRRAVYDGGIRTIQKHVSPELSRQRLNKDAVAWAPPAVFISALAVPSYPRISLSGSPIPHLRAEKNLYNRPPPPSLLFS